MLCDVESHVAVSKALMLQKLLLPQVLGLTTVRGCLSNGQRSQATTAGQRAMHGLHFTQAKAIVLDDVSLLEDDALRALTDLVEDAPRKYTPESIWPSGCSLKAFHLEVCWRHR